MFTTPITMIGLLIYITVTVIFAALTIALLWLTLTSVFPFLTSVFAYRVAESEVALKTKITTRTKYKPERTWAKAEETRRVAGVIGWFVFACLTILILIGTTVNISGGVIGVIAAQEAEREFAEMEKQMEVEEASRLRRLNQQRIEREKEAKRQEEERRAREEKLNAWNQFKADKLAEYKSKNEQWQEATAIVAALTFRQKNNTGRPFTARDSEDLIREEKRVEELKGFSEKLTDQRSNFERLQETSSAFGDYKLQAINETEREWLKEFEAGYKTSEAKAEPKKPSSATQSPAVKPSPKKPAIMSNTSPAASVEGDSDTGGVPWLIVFGGGIVGIAGGVIIFLAKKGIL